MATETEEDFFPQIFKTGEETLSLAVFRKGFFSESLELKDKEELYRINHVINRFRS